MVLILLGRKQTCLVGRHNEDGHRCRGEVGQYLLLPLRNLLGVQPPHLPMRTGPIELQDVEVQQLGVLLQQRPDDVVQVLPVLRGVGVQGSRKITSIRSDSSSRRG